MNHSIDNKKIPIWVAIIALIFLNFLPSAFGASQVPCFFVFGDSLVDNGNNNNLNTDARANYLPYGIDFPGGPTGRFTNGRNVADFLAELLGFNAYIPPFATAQGTDVVTKGVNYASGSAGIRNETGKQLGENISLDDQLQNHNLTISRIAQIQGNGTSAKQYLGKCLYFFVAGSNDYLNNYYKPDSFTSSKTYTPDEYAAALVQQYGEHLTALYNYGARKVAVSGISPIGCIPELVSKGTNGSMCNKAANDAVTLFNDKLSDLVDEFNKKFTDAKFVFVNATTMLPSDLVSFGMRLLGMPCCKITSNGQCVPGSAPCRIRPFHTFMDNFHPTEIVNRAGAVATYFELANLLF